jgi:aldose 1-epimerase
MAHPTGDQYELSLVADGHRVRAHVTQVGAALRGLTIDGEHLTEPYGADVPAPGANGIVMVPWPNRIDDGMWILDGQPQHLDISEPRFNNAIHGLLRFTPYTPVEQTDAAVTLQAFVFPQHGYPFHLDTRVHYELTPDGIAVTHTITNVGTQRAPVAIGAHPYLRLGDVPFDRLIITIAAGSRFESTQRMIPFVEMPVDRTEFDLRHGRSLSGVRLDEAFGEVEHVDGVATHAIEGPDGRRVELWQDENFGFVHVFTPRNYMRQGRPGLAVAIEPMTAPPNAFVTKRALRWLSSGDTWIAQWGIRYNRGHYA